MGSSNGGEVPPSSASHGDPMQSGTSCPELAVSFVAPFGDFSPAVPPSIDFGALSQLLSTVAFPQILADTSPSIDQPLLFLLLSTLRN